ncbi:heterokaryon incompatibility protein-domain-containing protein [Nemania abortiva]|nr:heterokaryon incompatibility protein-domain-containing protein [Nemania abortiva]
MSFQHQELVGNDQFRVLELSPAASRDEPLEFRIHHVAFTKHPGYAAISYTWDDQELSQTALCNNQNFKISQNCDKILRRLRPPFSYSSVFLWIDQICINQASYSDKAINVRQMGAIYQQAKTVLVWTGEYDGKLSEEVITAAHTCGDLGAIPCTITEHWHILYGTTRRSTLSAPKPTSFTTAPTLNDGAHLELPPFIAGDPPLLILCNTAPFSTYLYGVLGAVARTQQGPSMQKVSKSI